VTIVLGLDGGGTKTHVIVADADGGLLGAAAGGASNWEDVGMEAAAGAIRAVVLEALQAAQLAPEALDASVFGLAGNDWPSDLARLSTIPDSLRLGGLREVVNDAFVALRAGANHPWGIAVIAGTGSVVAGRNEAGAEFRTLGLGALYGDFGGSTEIADEGLRAVAEAYTGLGPATSLTAGYLAALGRASPEDLLEHTSRQQPPLSHLADVVLEAADAGDTIARAIAERAGTALGANAGLVARKLEMQEQAFEVVLAGGVLRASSRTVEHALKKELRRSAPAAFPVRLEVPPVVGAALRALENMGAEPGGPEHLRLSMETMRALSYGFI
jgi:N-acetylglucosamine kinase-like BadF-type ATPase